MNHFKKIILPIAAASVWISISEFVRNEFLLKSHWTNHYNDLGLVFPSEPVNGAVWGVWSMLFATAVLIISKKFNLIQTTLICWLMAFLMMWVVIGNMNVLPYWILVYAVPLSLFETFIAAWIIKKLS